MKNTTTLFSYKMAHRLTVQARAHGVAVDCLVSLLTEQGGRCAICRRPLTDLFVDGAQMHVEFDIGAYAPSSVMAAPHADFCPNTGLIRGLVCNPCLKLVESEATPYGAMARISKDRVKSQRKALRLMEYFSPKDIDYNLISSQWEPDPMNRA